MAGAEEDAPPILSCVSSRSSRPPLRSAARHHPAADAAARDQAGGGRHAGDEGKGRGVWVGRMRPLPAGSAAAAAIAKAAAFSSSSSSRRRSRGLSARSAVVEARASPQPVLRAAHRSTSLPHLLLQPTLHSPPEAAPPPRRRRPPPPASGSTTAATDSPPATLLTNNHFPPKVSASTEPPTVMCDTKNGSVLETESVLFGVFKSAMREGGVEEEEEEEEEDADDMDGEEGEDGGDGEVGAEKTGQRRAARYDSADSSDSGVGGEWIASSPCSSLTSSPPPRPEELDECCPGSAHPTPTPTPTAGARCTTPPPPAADNEHLLTCMAPNDGSGVRVGRKGGHDGDQLMGRFGPGGQMGHTPHKDRPPDTISLPVRATRRTAPHDAAHRRRRVQAAHARKRSGEEEEEVGMGAERRTKLPRASPPPSPLNGVRRLNGCVNGGGEAADLLERLAGLPEASEKGGRPAHPAHRNNGLSKDSLQNGVGHLLGKNGIKCYNGSVNGRVNGAVRPDRQDPQFNNNIEPTSLPPSPAKLSHSDALPHTRAHAPTAAKRATQGIPHPTQGITLSCDVGLTPPLPSPRAAHQPPASPTAARCSANSSPPPAHTSPCNSKSRSSSASSGVGSSAPSSGTSTPTPTVRFPPPEKKEAADVCRWRECNLTLDPASSLLEHIQAVHVEGQLEAESFRCLWVGCKVYDKASCSVSWLERHVLTHGGHKPFKCIVDGCGQRFTSQTALGRHVNHHFSTTTTVPSPRPPAQPSPSKLIRKNGRKCRYRKKPWSDSRAKVPVPARMFDMFDVGVMECVRWRLMCVTQIQNGGSGQASDQTFTLRPQVLARRTCSKGIKEVLVRWSPPGVLADEWVAMDQLEATQNVPLEQLSPEAKQTVTQLCYPSLARPQKHRRKRPSCPKSLSLDIFKAV
ncbi:uncharacterized protein jing isoform X4 [Panulirus ornatus]|uniref:uncharacterized protein jing isoform X4 n=1 Tax=Panulirus ornatus TaxID=150431 RepID=UPI003A880F48